MPTTAVPADRRIQITAGEYEGRLGTVLVTGPEGSCTVRADDDPAGRALPDQPHEFTAAESNALLVGPTGTALRVNLPTGRPQRRTAAAQILEGEVEYIRLAACVHGVPVLSLAVLRHGADQPVNHYATLITEILPGGPGRNLRGPVLFFGAADDHGWPTDLGARERQIIEKFIGALRTEFSSPLRP
ncbi:hypothetical protein [Kitasatospora purpeofusca]|uniref:hypothetical protein n=1 Tax=Kitasatospora purpeofusca TaxID=67352 RepID=UPI002A59C44C|nr:hypothetical protein [Kitasatospora purpeofusca]MDY0811414.1 hypothetical protein [Kitasatospora purpeofusca]